MPAWQVTLIAAAAAALAAAVAVTIYPGVGGAAACHRSRLSGVPAIA